MRIKEWLVWRGSQRASCSNSLPWVGDALLQAEQAQFPQTFFLSEVLQPSDHLCVLPPDLLPQLHILLVLGASGLNTALQMGPQEDRTKRAIPSFSLLAALHTVGLPSCKNTLLVCVELFVHQDLQALLHRAALSKFFSQSAHVYETAPTQVQHFACSLAEPH